MQSVQFSISVPLNAVRTVLDVCAALNAVRTTSIYVPAINAVRIVRTPSISVPAINAVRTPSISVQSVPAINAGCTHLGFYAVRTAINAGRTHPRFLCNPYSNKCSSIFVPTRSLFSKLPRKSCPLSPLFSTLCSSSLFFSQEWKVKCFASLNPFCLNPKWESNPTVEKDPIQWLRFNESKNHIYLNHLNKFTHPLKFIKKWL